MTIPSGSNFSIDGKSANRIMINGNNQSRVFSISPGSALILTNLAIIRGIGIGLVASGSEGGILNNGGSLMLLNATVNDNHAAIGGIVNRNGGTLNISNSTVSGNQASADGGDLNNAATTVRLIFSMRPSTTIKRTAAAFIISAF